MTKTTRRKLILAMLIAAAVGLAAGLLIELLLAEPGGYMAPAQAGYDHFGTPMTAPGGPRPAAYLVCPFAAPLAVFLGFLVWKVVRQDPQ